jgi:UDP-2-acetamido-2,6-beta-L-arabino-hexul-4-ose reductase
MIDIQPSTQNKILRVGITGQSGFMGTHLFNWLGLFPGKYSLQPFRDEYFKSAETLREWVSNCDAIIHLAALNRHGNPQIIYDTNIALVRDLIIAMEAEEVTPHVIFSSSTQEEQMNLYGKSKKEGRELLRDWAERQGGKFTGMVIPNVFGPFGNPYYNSVIATFCYQITHREKPCINSDAAVKLIYIGELAEEVMNILDMEVNAAYYPVKHTSEKSISEIFNILTGFKEQYFDQGIIPAFRNNFELQLFNTFCCYIDIKNYFPVKLRLNTDERGIFTEIIRTDIGGQTSFSTTKPGITRGNHFHTRKIERFAVVRGKACIRLRRLGTDEVISFELSGDAPAYVDIPIWYTHNISNTGNEDLYTIFWISEKFDPSDPDTYFTLIK